MSPRPTRAQASAPLRRPRRVAVVRAAALSAVLTLSALLGACRASDAATGVAPDIGGTYTLRAVGLDTLPATVFDSTFESAGVRVRIAITGGSMMLGPAGGYIFSLTYTYLVNDVGQPVYPLGDRGTYSRTGSALVFTSIDGGGSMNGTLADGKLTVAQDLLDNGAPLILAYRK